jgi:exo-beta-1,3-glucanase (GH17 family)/cellulose synthase/poly-beta-1,6-N-acetylglucosamine synthase-like glycosyltransferase
MRSLAAMVALAVCLHAGLWAGLRGEARAPDVYGQLNSVSYAPYGKHQNGQSGDSATEEQIRADMPTLAWLAKSVRTYSSTNGGEKVASIANEFGLKASIGAWLDKDSERAEREIASVIDIAKHNSNVNAVVVGNETILRKDLTPAELIEQIRRVKKAVNVPVTTGEVWDTWLEHPELVSEVDFIAAHILPYWEGFSTSAAVDHAVSIYNKLREAYPGKRIVIAEFGWPSAGYNNKDAIPGPLEQAEVIRGFVASAQAIGMDYNIIEAVDQPWKAFEGSVGPYWGLTDANRQTKFDWSGPIFKTDHWKLAGLALAFGFLLSLPILSIRGATYTQSAFLATAAHMTGAWLASIAAYWQGHYFVPGAAIAFGIGVLMLVPLVIIILARIEEIAAVAFGRQPSRLIDEAGPMRLARANIGRSSAYLPKVSIHIPAHKEQPDMLIRTLDSVAALDYPNFECIVAINNTTDERLTKPVEEHCQRLGERFKFLNLQNVKGFKAGALRIALDDHTAADAEIIGLIDADYVVEKAWLSDLVSSFVDPRVGLVQAPQDHRDGGKSPLAEAMNGEYAGFFDIGMVQRNEANAIVTHGTMLLLRRSALDAAGGWSSDTICEDTDLGLSMLEKGYTAEYTRRRYGFGLLPDTYEAFRKQRHRWAYGGLQIIKKHWRRLLPNASQLSVDQRREFASGWMSWLGAETLGVAMAILNLISVPLIVLFAVAVPDKVLTGPILASFAISLLHFVALYRLRCPMPARVMTSSLITAMSVQWTIASAVATGLIKDNLPFNVTAKGGAQDGANKRNLRFQAKPELLLGSALVIGALILIATNAAQVREVNVFAAVLVLQSLPFLAAAGIAWFEGSVMNDFVYWRTLDAKLAGLLPARQPPQAANDPAPVVATKKAA